jgi:pantoate--beta-alanine ligase
MEIVKSTAGMQKRAREWRRHGIGIGFVPTMGCLHEGHLSLMRQARQCVGKEGQVVVSIYVNPTQFGPKEDYKVYPRDLARDRQWCREAGVDVLFTPSDADMYPGGKGAPFSTYVVEERLSQGMEGASRPTHFRGVTTVVAKLFNLVMPDVAVFGAKDFQQAAVIRKMVKDLSFAVRILVAPTIREKDGLAKSSRNQYLDSEERQQAVALWEALQWARQRVKEAGAPVDASELREALASFIHQRPQARVDYIEFFDPETLGAAGAVTPGMHMALAVFVGKTRLIDNGRL